jgi:hypothetical protein
MEVRKLARALAWAFCACVGFVVLAYVALLAVNWSDEAPSKDAIALTRIVASKPDVPDTANAWVFELGLAAPEGQDPLALGLKRKAFMTHYIHSVSQPSLPGPEIQYRDARSPEIAAIAEACMKGDADCVRLVNADPGSVDRWLASEHWLLERFVRMETLREWKEVIPVDPSAPIGPYQHAIHGQQLLLMHAWKQARDGDSEGARATLHRDFVFWRMVLLSADTLIAKMIANVALKRNLSLGNLVLRDLHAAGKTSAPPAAWLVPITRGERSMRRVFAGEYIFQSSLTSSVADKPGLVSPNKVGDALMRPLYQPQSTSNLVARSLTRESERFDVDYPAIPAATETLPDLAWGEHKVSFAYNPIGRVIYGAGGFTDMGGYAVRVSDLEGVRRAALLASEMRENPQAASPACECLRNPRWKNPYTQAPFEWDAKTASIVFTGLESGERGRHAMLL